MKSQKELKKKKKAKRESLSIWIYKIEQLYPEGKEGKGEGENSDVSILKNLGQWWC